MERFGVALLLFACMAGVGSPPAAAEPVRFETSDGFVLHGDLARAADAKAPAAILLHQFNAERASWAPLVPALSRAGFTVLAFDQRGQGESKTRRTSAGEESVDLRALATRDRAAVAPLVRAGRADVEAAVQLLAQRGLATDRIVLVGSSYGCSVALLATATLPAVRALGLLSPGTAYFGVEVGDLAVRFTGPIALYAAADDAPAAASVRRFAADRGKPDEVTIFATGGHGVALFASHPALAGALAETLTEAVRR